jgi:hypothetical protein
MVENALYSRWRVRLLCSTACLGSIVFGYYLVEINPYTEEIAKHFGWDKKLESVEIGLLTSILYMAAVVGCVMQATYLNRFKNRFLMVGTDIISIAAILT